MSTTRHRPVFLALFGAILAGSSGCTTTPYADESFGASVRANLSAQVLDPLGAANADPTLGIDGAAARATQERYQRAFKEPDSAADQPMVGRGQ
jgi:type IV pilus biogenesis protein CpaD/CtpE